MNHSFCYDIAFFVGVVSIVIGLFAMLLNNGALANISNLGYALTTGLFLGFYSSDIFRGNE